MLPHANHDTEILEEIQLETLVEKDWKLVVYNDDVNTFDHVIQALIEVCGHSPIQAEQCTLMIHYKGRATVKQGEYEELVQMRTGITDRHISAEVEA